MEKDWGKHAKQKKHKRERCMETLAWIMGQQQGWCDWNVLSADGRGTSVGRARLKHFIADGAHSLFDLTFLPDRSFGFLYCYRENEN